MPAPEPMLEPDDGADDKTQRAAFALQQKEFDHAVLAACDTMREIWEADARMTNGIAMAFLKSVSDTHKRKRALLQQKFGDDDERILAALACASFVLPADCTFDALYAERHAPGNGWRIDQALRKIELANPGRLDGVFLHVTFDVSEHSDSRLIDAGLRCLMEDFVSLKYIDANHVELHAAANAFALLIDHAAASQPRRRERFFTPPGVAELMADLARPQPDDDIGDPFCGAGSLLRACAQLLERRHAGARYALYGQESVRAAWAVAKMNLLLQEQAGRAAVGGPVTCRIEWGDTIRDPKLLDGDARLMQFDVVLANPPHFSGEWGHEGALEDRFGRFKFGIPPRAKGTFAAILHAITSMKPVHGRAVLVVPQGVLFRDGAEANIRRAVLAEQLLDAVIGLPAKLFYGSNAATVILVFRQTKSDDGVLFVDASKGFLAGKHQNTLRPQDLQRIIDACQKRHDVPQFSYLASMAEIAANHYQLHVPRYVGNVVEEPPVDLSALMAEIREMMRESDRLETQLDGYLEMLGFI